MAKKSELIQVGELAVGFSENVLPDTDDLKGRRFKLYFEDGFVSSYRFLDEKTLAWEIEDSSGNLEKDEEDYRATCPRENIYFVDYIRKNSRATSVSLVLDFKKGIATSLSGTLPKEEDARMDRLGRVGSGLFETAVEAIFKSASIDKKFNDKTPRHQPTKDLIGKRVKYIYSQKDTYEHIYLNDDHYTWHCLAGIEKGMADTDLCHYFKIDQDLYLFVWREKLVPTLGVVVIDLKKMKTTGKIFGYESGDFGNLSNFPVGAFAQHV
ncbi:molybdenum cofactor biosynthesis F family protein [bacterium]|nr:molybdenum cofactor biosynthesis F family protein [bacterium]